MHRCTCFLVLVFLLFPAHAYGGTSDIMIELHARCLAGNPCLFSGQMSDFSGDMIDVELELFNAGSASVQLPIEYFREQGPKVILVDNHSGKEKRLGMGPPMGYLFDQMQELAPGQSIKIPWMVAPDEIDAFALRPIDITVVFLFDLTPRAPLAEKRFVSASLHIMDGGVGELQRSK